MGATIKFIQHPVGEGLPNRRSDVLALQQLLIAAGINVKGGADGGWGKHTGDALIEYQNKKTPSAPNAVSASPQKLKVEPGDEILLQMAVDAQIVIPMPIGPGATGLQQTHKWFSDNGIKYQQGAESGGGNRAIYGVEGDKRYAVQQTNFGYYAGPIQMDCTTYVNLMLSIYIQGQVHTAPYDASCKAYGAASNNHCARERYGLPLVYRIEGQGPAQKKQNFFKTADQIVDVTKSSPGKLYVLEVGGGAQGGVSHMAICLGEKIYECTTNQPRSACIDRTVAEFMANKQGKIIYVFGPR
jgi:hypothetical protein